jgi:iron complex outermembrane recepter protein
MIKLYPLLFAVTAFFTANAQKGNISGVVTTSDNQPAPYVNVMIKEINRGTTSGDNGSFMIKDVPEGKYTLITSFIGLQTQEKEIEVRSGETTQADFTLTESAQQLEEIVVSDTRGLNELLPSIGKGAIKPMDLPQAVMVIDKTVLERLD